MKGTKSKNKRKITSSKKRRKGRLTLSIGGYEGLEDSDILIIAGLTLTGSLIISGYKYEGGEVLRKSGI